MMLLIPVVLSAAMLHNTVAQQPVSARDHLLGWYKLGDSTLVPVFRFDRTYYSVIHPGIEIPLKECPEGLEWAVAPSSMVGTKICFNEKSEEVYIRIVDAIREKVESSFVSGEKRPLNRVERPLWLPDATAPPPRAQDDFLGWYKPVWCPDVRLQIRKEDTRYFAEFQMHRGVDKTSKWEPEGKPHELSLLPDRLGFVMKQKDGVTHHLVYNTKSSRFELAGTNPDTSSSKMPLARITAPSSETESAPSTHMRVGIPSWH